jgi:quinol monooxygenase YgiN
MVKFIARFYIKSGCEEDYLRELRPCVEATRKEPGCLEYLVFWNAETNVATLMETFKDNEAAEIHKQYPHFKNDFKALSKYYASKPEVERFENPII